MINNNFHLDKIESSNQRVNASVELFNGSMLAAECTCNDILSDFQVERGGEGKFFGYGVSQKAKVALADINREINENDIDTLRLNYLGGGINGGNLLVNTDFSNKTSDTYFQYDIRERKAIVKGNSTSSFNKNIRLDFTENAINNLRNSTVTLSGEYCALSAIEYGSKFYFQVQIKVGRNSTSGGSSQTLAWDGSNEIQSAPIGTWFPFKQTFTIDDDNFVTTAFFVYTRYFVGEIGVRNLKVEFGNEATPYEPASEDAEYKVTPYPTFYIESRERDEQSNLLTLTAYDVLYNASKYTFADLGLFAPYTLNDVVTACARIIGANGVAVSGAIDTTIFDRVYDTGINVEGGENIRDIINAIAEITQTIYYINYNNELCFKRLVIDGDGVYTIGRDRYIKLISNGARTLTNLCHATELGDNLVTVSDAVGDTQYMRDNPFLEVEPNIDVLLEEYLLNVANLTINELECDWMGNYLLEIGDRVAFITEDGGTIYSYILDEAIAFTGMLSQLTKWSYGENNTETAANPINLGDALKQTFAKVDKANKSINLVVSEVNANKEEITALRSEIEQLPEQVKISITEEIIAEGVDSVTTSTGFTFNQDGLTIEKSGREIKTQITEDGMAVFKDGEEVLTANNAGVVAKDLHAKTYLKIGTNSRLENYGSLARTACFWVGN